MARFTTVTFEDADGDEFPVRLEGNWETTHGDGPAVEAAKAKLAEFEASGDLKPTHPIKRALVTYPS